MPPNQNQTGQDVAAQKRTGSGNKGIQKRKRSLNGCTEQKKQHNALGKKQTIAEHTLELRCFHGTFLLIPAAKRGNDNHGNNHWLFLEPSIIQQKVVVNRYLTTIWFNILANFLYKYHNRLYNKNNPKLYLYKNRKGWTSDMFSDRLKQARKSKKISQAELSRQLGVTQQAVGKWETGRSTPDPAMVARLAELLDTTTDMLLGLQQPDRELAVGRQMTGYTESPIPVVGTVRAGYGALAFEEDYGTEYACVKDPANYFYLVVKGDSMEPRISDGDLALVHRQTTLENGELGVMVYGTDGEGTLKKYIRRGNAVVLHPFNPAYEDLIIKGEELDHLYIAGKVVETKTKW